MLLMWASQRASRDCMTARVPWASFPATAASAQASRESVERCFELIGLRSRGPLSRKILVCYMFGALSFGHTSPGGQLAT